MSNVQLTGSTTQRADYGILARKWSGKRLPLQVLQSRAGYYIGTAADDGPCSRESARYWSKQAEAEAALASGEWPHKDRP